MGGTARNLPRGNGLTASVAWVAIALVLAACGSGGASGGGASGLVGALGTVKDSSEARTYFEWSDLAAVRKLAGLPSTVRGYKPPRSGQRWTDIFGVGTNGLVQYALEITPKTSIDLFAADRAIGIGQPPNQAMRVDGGGVDTASITRSLLALGFKRSMSQGRTFLALGAEHSANLNGPLGSIGVVNQLDRVVATGHTLAAGPAVAPVDAVLGGGRSLASDPAYRAAASCLGNVVVAAMAPPEKLNAATPAALVAVGVLKPASGTAPVQEVVCAVDGSAAAARRQEATMRSVLGPSGRIPQTRASRSAVQSLTVSQRASSSFTMAKGLITLRPSVPAGFLYRVMTQGDLGSVLGAEIQPRFR